MQETSGGIKEGGSQIGKRPTRKIVVTTRLIDDASKIGEKTQPIVDGNCFDMLSIGEILVSLHAICGD